ncbi:MAG: type II toxin-antitoxin system HicB family antitoxin [Clostridia bacterium]|nr:type II toxin-antitoxin system HicB family antitoxin [Clostridia bacterium]
MKATYPIVLIPVGIGYVVYIPDFDINTQGHNYDDAIHMAKDAIRLMMIDLEADGRSIPSPTAIESVEHAEGEMVIMIDVNFV